MNINKFQPSFNAIKTEELFLAVGTLYKIPRITTLATMTLLPPTLLQNLKKHKHTTATTTKH